MRGRFGGVVVGKAEVFGPIKTAFPSFGRSTDLLRSLTHYSSPRDLNMLGAKYSLLTGVPRMDLRNRELRVCCQRQFFLRDPMNRCQKLQSVGRFKPLNKSANIFQPLARLGVVCNKRVGLFASLGKELYLRAVGPVAVATYQMPFHVLKDEV